MLKWVRLHLGDGTFEGKELLDKSRLRALHKPQIVLGGPSKRQDISSLGYAMGWFAWDYRGHLVIEHGGVIDGFISAVAFYPDDGVGIVAFTNSHNPLLALLRRHAADRIFGLEPVPWLEETHEKWVDAKAKQKEAKEKEDLSRHTGTSPSRALESYVGSYSHAGYGEANVSIVGDTLTMTHNDITTSFEHWHFDVFKGLENKDDPTYEDMRIQFIGNMKGDIVELHLPFESSLDPIVFEKQADEYMSDPEYLQRFVGVYMLMSQEVTVALQGESLTLSFPGQSAVTLEPAGTDEFDAQGMKGFRVRFISGENGSMTAWFDQPSGSLEAKRKQ